MVGRRGRWVSAAFVAVAAWLLAAPSARAIEAFDGRLQVHGFTEMQIRGLDNGFSEELDLAQWYNVINVEIEADIAPDGWAFFDLIEAYARVEGRYDCIYTRGCGMFRSADAYGNRTNHIPLRLRDAEDQDVGGVIPTDFPAVYRIDNEKPADLFTYTDKPNSEYLDPVVLASSSNANLRNAVDPTSPDYKPEVCLEQPDGSCTANPQFNPEIKRDDFDRRGFPGLGSLFANPGSDALVETGDDPARYVFESVLGWKFYLQETTGRVLRGGTRILGPMLPKNTFTNIAALRDRANPFRGERPPSPTGSFRIDTVLDPRLAELDGSTPHGIRLRTQAESGFLNLEFGDQPGVLIPNSRRFRGFSGDFSGVVPWREPKLVEAEDVAANRTTEAIQAQQGVNRLLNCQPGDFACPIGTSPAAIDDPNDPNYGFDALAPGTGQRGVFQVMPFSNILLTAGNGELPLRPGPDRSNLDPSPNYKLLNAQGLYIPSRGLRHALMTQDFDTHPFNISETDRSWNRGDSQQDTKELKEAFVDVEMFDSRGWFRGGLQNIVWGKTELFRTTDQFNPQDFALASIPSLEESRIALWSARYVHSLYEVGPLEDVRVELAMNYDDYQPADLGGCGEPYTIDVVCGLTLGLAAHSFAGLGVAGIDRPADPWKSPEGIEFGGRVEWRWDRFSMAITDFYGYDDFPYVDQISYFSRNVDLMTGRPLIMHLLTEPIGDCAHPTPGTVSETDGRTFDDASAWQSMTLDGIGADMPCLKAGGAPGGTNENQYGGAQNALENHPANLQLFSVICGASVGVSNIAPSNCQLSIFQSDETPDPALFDFGVIELISQILSGEPASSAVLIALTNSPRGDLNVGGVPAPQTGLNRDGGASGTDVLTPRDSVNCLGLFAGPLPCDPTGVGDWTVTNGNYGRGSDGIITALDPTINIPNPTAPFPCNTINNNDDIPPNEDVDCRIFSFYGQIGTPGDVNDSGDRLTLDNTLTNEQRYLIGCGPFAGTRCDSSDIVFDEETGLVMPAAGGVDLLMSDASFLAQAFVGIEGTEPRNLTPEYLAEWDFALANPGVVGPQIFGSPATVARVTNACRFIRNEVTKQSELQVDGSGNCTDDVMPTWLTTASTLVQPASIRLGDGEMFPLGATCTYYNEKTGGVTTLPGCRGIETFQVSETAGEMPTEFTLSFEEGYLPSIDGCVVGRDSEQVKEDDVALDIAGVPVVVTLADGTPVNVDPNSTDDGYAGELGRQLAACADRLGTVFTSSTREPVGTEAGGKVLIASRLGAHTLFHPVAGCRVPGGLDVEGNPINVNTVTGDDDGESCEVLLRDFVQNFQNDPNSVQIFRTEGAALSFNLQMFLVATSCNGDTSAEIREDPECFDLERPYRADRCSFAAPQFCSGVKGFLGGAGVQRNVVKAGSRNGVGVRRWPWHSGGEAMIRYKKRNVLGFSADFAEDATKSNWGVEFTWISSHPTFNSDSFNNVTNVDTMNMTVSVDRPTFINFLNANRTFFFNSQWFLQYIANYRQGMLRTGPFNVLFTFAVFTGYFQDRLLPTFVSIYDFGSRSGGFLPSIQYRFTENFSATMGMNIFFGREQTGPMPVRGLGPAGNATDPEELKYKASTENFISAIRKRDEVFLRVRWTF